MAKVETQDGKTYKIKLTDTVNAARKMLDKNNAGKKVLGLVRKEETIRIQVTNGNE